MLDLLWLCALFAAAKAQEAVLMDRIIHGKEVDIRDHPYQVALVNKRNHIICGGALVNHKVVFTAAHCTHVTDDEKRKLSVLVGANHVRDKSGVVHKIKRVHKHPGFHFGSFDNDFSVIILKEPVEFNDRVQKIPISLGNHREGALATASGWGRTETGRQAKYLRAADLLIERWDKCQEHFPGYLHPRITKNMLCVKPGRKTTYYGDSGGPLVVDGHLVGLVSFGRTVVGDKKTTVFTRVRNFVNFAEKVAPEYWDIDDEDEVKDEEVDGFREILN